MVRGRTVEGYAPVVLDTKAPVLDVSLRTLGVPEDAYNVGSGRTGPAGDERGTIVELAFVILAVHFLFYTP